MLGLHWARDFAHPGGGGRTVNMTFHNGPVMPAAATAAVFWGTSWDPRVGDEISGMDSWYTGFNGSNYAGTSNEYSGTNGQVTSATSYLGHQVDNTAASGGASTSPILAEACKVYGNSVPTDGSAYIAVYTDLPRGSAGYCAWHSWGSCGSTPVQFAFFWKLDGDAGCDPQSTVANESQGLAALANVSGHELSEARTDPRGTGWFDQQGAENGDKCAWISSGQGAAADVTFSTGTFPVQSLWSNAFNSGAGGCVLSY